MSSREFTGITVLDFLLLAALENAEYDGHLAYQLYDKLVVDWDLLSEEGEGDAAVYSFLRQLDLPFGHLFFEVKLAQSPHQ